jgi:uncharacterized protein YggE
MRVFTPWLVSPVLAAALSFALVAPGHADDDRRISVTGEATVYVVPDIATISLGVTSQAETAAAALKANTAALTAVLARLKAAGIEARDLQTSNLSIDPVWNANSSTGVNDISAYAASNQVTVTVRNLDHLGEVLDQAVVDGANRLNGLSFDLADKRAVQDEARKQAVQNAISRAKLLTESAGTHLGQVVSIDERVQGEGPRPMMRAMALKSDAAVPVERGEMGIQALVSMTWKLAD